MLAELKKQKNLFNNYLLFFYSFNFLLGDWEWHLVNCNNKRIKKSMIWCYLINCKIVMIVELLWYKRNKSIWDKLHFITALQSWLFSHNSMTPGVLFLTELLFRALPDRETLCWAFFSTFLGFISYFSQTETWRILQDFKRFLVTVTVSNAEATWPFTTSIIFLLCWSVSMTCNYVPGHSWDWEESRCVATGRVFYHYRANLVIIPQHSRNQMCHGPVEYWYPVSIGFSFSSADRI